MVDYYKDNPNVTVIVDRREGAGPPQDPARETGGKRETRDRRRPRIPGTFLEAEGERGTRIARWRLIGAKTFKNYIDGEWVDAASGETFEHEPRERRDDRHVPALDGARTSTAPSRREGGLRGLAPRPRAERGEILYRFAQLLTEQKEELSQLMTREMGKVLARGPRRRPGSDRHGLLHGRRGPAPVRPDHAVRAPRQVQHERPPCRSASSA